MQSETEKPKFPSYYDGIVFDLDGTLWQTRDSYLYAYHQAMAHHPEISERYSDEEILATMGKTLFQLGRIVFSSLSPENQLKIMMECLEWSCRYLLENPSTVYPYVMETLKILSKRTRLFIVSNCPKEYLEVFFQKSQTEALFFDCRYLSFETTKSENLQNIIKANGLHRILMVGDSFDDYDASKDCHADFAYSAYGYRQCNRYDYWLDRFDDLIKIMDFVDIRESILEKADFYKHLRVLDAQVTLMKNRSQKGIDFMFGFWRFSQSDAANRELFEKLEQEAKLAQATEIIGPMDYATWFSYRLATDEFDWNLYPDIANTQEQVRFLENEGYTVKSSYVSTLATIDYGLWNLAKKVKLGSNYKIISVHGMEAYALLPDIYEISAESFRNADYFSAIDYDTFQNIYVVGLQEITPYVVMIYDQDEPIAFSFCYPNPDQEFYVSKTVGIKEKHRNSKLILKIIDYAFQLMTAAGYKEVLYHFQSEQKNTLDRVWKKTKIRQKHYALFTKRIK